MVKTQEYLLGDLSSTAEDHTTLSDESQKNVEILNSDRIGGMLYYKIIFIQMRSCGITLRLVFNKK